MSVVEDRVDHLEAENEDRKAENKVIHQRLDRRRHWWVTIGITGIVMGLAGTAGSYLAARGVVHETRAREAQSCQQRVEGREGVRTLVLAVLPLTPPASPAHGVLQNLLSTSLAPLPPC